MQKRLILPLTVFALITSIQTLSQQRRSEYDELLRQNKCAQAEKVCTKLAASNALSEEVEGLKCLSNVSLCGESTMAIMANDRGGGSLRPSYKPEAVDKAIAYLNRALKLAPQDLSIHQGRLYLLEISYRYEDMTKALDESCQVYKGPDALSAWIAYTYELSDEGQLNGTVGLLKVLERHYPASHEVLGNMGAVLFLLKKDEEALPYLQKAVELAPNDPIDTWNLGRAYDYLERFDLAEGWYQTSLKLDSDEERRSENTCLFAEFIETKLKDRARACPLQKENCPTKRQTACAKAP